MTEKNNINKENTAEQVLETTEEQVEVAEVSNIEAIEEVVSSKEAELQAELEILKKEAEMHRERFLLAKAEADNIRKRSEKEVSNARKYALEKFIPDLLSVKDAMELGVKAATENQEEMSKDSPLAKFAEGSEMAIGMFMDTLKKVGVDVISPEGETFNPEFHQAMTMVPNDELAPNTVIDVVQKGYTLNDRLLRPAMVIVSKKS